MCKRDKNIIHATNAVLLSITQKQKAFQYNKVKF